MTHTNTDIQECTKELLKKLNISETNVGYAFIIDYMIYRANIIQTEQLAIKNFYRFAGEKHNMRAITVETCLRKSIREILADNHQILRDIFDKSYQNFDNIRSSKPFLEGLYQYLKKTYFKQFETNNVTPISEITCCDDCTKRHLHCHSTCKTYNNQRRGLNAFNIEMAKNKKNTNEIVRVLRASTSSPKRYQKKYHMHK